MKKIIFSLMALMCTLSINAQIIKVMKGNTVVKEYTAAEADNVVFEEAAPAPAPGTIGTAKATIGGSEVDVNWVQLWENGPKFAEYNVGVTDGKAESYGGYYCWGSSIEKDPSTRNTDSDPLTDDDTATNLWGSNWRMPTITEFDALSANCDSEWISVNGIIGMKITGRGDYAYNSIFLPAAGYWNPDAQEVYGVESIGYFWSSTPSPSYSAISLHFGYGSYPDPRSEGHSVRAVLKEN